MAFIARVGIRSAWSSKLPRADPRCIESAAVAGVVRLHGEFHEGVKYAIAGRLREPWFA
jgi:hypothetical protein